MNMALRPFSLLLLLVMIPAISMLDSIYDANVYNEMTCDLDTWFCYMYEWEKIKNFARYTLKDASAFHKKGAGLAIDTTQPNVWKVIFGHWFDPSYPTQQWGCSNTFISNTMDVVISCKQIIDTQFDQEFDEEGISIKAKHWYESWGSVKYELKVSHGSYIADKFKLFANPDFKIAFYRKMDSDGTVHEGKSEIFRPYSCKIDIKGKKPDDSAVEATKVDSKYSCGSGQTIFLEGTNTHDDTVYCGGEGWFSKDTNMMILKRDPNKQTPYCVKNVMFADCTNNKCFVFRDSLDQPKSDDLFVKVDDPSQIKNKLGAYLVFEADTKWKLHVAYLSNRDGDLTSITIGKKSFAISPHPFGVKTESNVDMKIERSGPRLITGFHGFVFTLEAKTDEPEKDLMVLFGFYKGEENKIKLVVDGQEYQAAGVANFGYYEKKSPVIFPRTSAEPQGKPNAHNIFTCEKGKTIYLDAVRTGETEIRYTKKNGWLKRDGSLVSSGDAIVPGVYCFTVCHEESLTLTAVLNDPKPIKDQAKMEYKCIGDVVKVNSKLYASVSCENDQWKGDQEFIASPAPQFTFSAECYGGFKFVKTCVHDELNNGCGEVKVGDGVLTCHDGFLLTLEGHDDKKIRTSLRVDKADQWVDGDAVIAKTKTGDKPVCYSKCAVKHVDTKATGGANTVNAEYKYDVNQKTGTLKCPDQSVLVMSLDGKKRSFVTEVTCDKDGWKAVSGKVADHQSGAVNPECFKSCALERLTNDMCPTGYATEDCGTGQRAYSAARLLSCPESHVLFVNDLQMSTALECKKVGWVKEGTTGSPDDLIIDHTINYDKEIKAECFAKCGKKLVTYSTEIEPTRTVSQLDLKCKDDSHMISYTLNNVQQDTLEDLKCEDKTGWKAGSAQITTFSPGVAATMNVICKPSCSPTLITKNCDDRSKGCAEPILTGTELTCAAGKWLYAQDKAEIGAIECKRKTFASKASSTAAIKIDRTSPTSTAEISCISMCDKTLMETAAANDLVAKKVEEAGKFTGIDDGGKFVVECRDELHYTTITHENSGVNRAAKWTCDPATGWRDNEGIVHKTTEATWFDGKPTAVGCLNKCKNRFKASASDPCTSPECEKPKDDNNELACDSTHVLRTGEKPGSKYFDGGKLLCKKDGFYENDVRELSFEAKPEDEKEQFVVSCISKCAVELVNFVDQSMKDKLKEQGLSEPAHFYKITPDAKKMKCNDDEILFIHSAENPGKGRRVFGETECKEAVGWTGKVDTKDASGAWTTGDETIVGFASQSPKIVASCIKVCATEMLNDKCTTTMPAEICTRKDYTGSTLSCPPNYRLFLNDKKSQDSSATNTLKCSKEGWKDGNEVVIDFRETPDQIPTIAEVHCKHKCHKDFIEFTHDSCPVGKTCSEAKYEGGKEPELSCTGATEILVIEHGGMRRESFQSDASNPPSSAKCTDAGWKGEGPDALFALDKQDFHIKARCEDICTPFPHEDKGPDNQLTSRAFDASSSVLTCKSDTEMLALEETDIAGAVVKKGVYADMICSKKGWSTVKWNDEDGTLTPKADELKISFTAMIDDAKVTEQDAERAKKFTCVENDCLRSFKCKGHEYSKVGTEEDCINPNITKIKYEMSCTRPSKLTSPNIKGVSYDTLRCFDGAWKSTDQSTLADKLNPDSNELSKPVSERPAFNVFCNADACTGCAVGDLTIIKSTTDANIAPYEFNEGTFKTCSQFKCGSGADYLVEESGKNKYYRNTGSNTIKCSSNKHDTRKTFTAPDGKSNIGGKVGCVKQIPCNEHRPLQTDCEGLKSTCDSDAFKQRLKIGSLTSESEPVTCDTLGRMYYQKDAGKTGWKIVDKLLCTKTGEWSVTYYEVKDEKKEHVFGPEILPEMMKLDSSKAGTNPRVICAVLDPNPEAKKPDIDPKTETCTYCPFPPVLECKDGCKNAQEHATVTNDGKGKCEMKIVNGRFKINGGDEIDKGTVLTCQMIDGKYPWMTPDGKKIDSLAVIMKDSDNISTGAITGIVIAVILVLGLIVFAMVYVAIRKRRAKEQAERLKSKGLEQKIDSIIDGATIVDDTKTLVL